jgi:hypothetical protein
MGGRSGDHATIAAELAECAEPNIFCWLTSAAVIVMAIAGVGGT